MCGVNKKRTDRGLNIKSIKGQFTMFIILGLVIFFVFAFALYARAKILNSQLALQANIQLTDYLDKNSINQYVTSCLDVVADDVFLTASRQGGLLNDTGKILGQDYILYNDSFLNRTFEVAIVINNNSNCPDGSSTENYLVTQEPGPYPYICGDRNLSVLPNLYLLYGNNKCRNNCTTPDFRKYSGFFGINSLPMLCSLTGANAPSRVSGVNSLTCDYYDYNRSMQQILEEQIASDMDRCVNFTEVLERIPSNITKIGNVTAIITFSQGNFEVKLRYPFTILMRNKQPITRIIDFSIDRDLPFKELYEYTYELANYDVKDVKFDVVNDKDKVIGASARRNNINIYNSNYIVNLIQGDALNNFTNIIQVTDLGHKLRGIPLTINLGVRNRAPALEYIHYSPSPEYDMVGIENSTLTILPQGYDPDDEKDLTYNYGGWLQDYLEYYNWSDPLCSHPDTFDYILEKCTIINTSATAEQVWTNSYLYNATRQNSSYNATNSDMGLHKVIVRVFDRNGLEDYQEVKILIFDLPIPKINSSNYYEDVDNTRASYEDLYVLNGSESSVGVIQSVIPGSTLVGFIWNDSSETFGVSKQITTDTSTMVVLIPNDTDGSHLVDIMNITDSTFKKKFDGNEVIASTIHNISLKVIDNNGNSKSNTYYVNVTQCLNHSNDNNAAYPYNHFPNDLQDALQADHTCCGNDFMYKDKNNECYHKIYYGLYNSFINYHYYNNIDNNPSYNIINIPDPLPNQYDNDIFKQEFIRNCSGNRGNVCLGDSVETRNDTDQCRDDNNPNNIPTVDSAFQKGRCFGPESQYVTNPNTYSDTLLTCVPYSGHTFEEYIGTATDNLCTNGPQCSNGDIFQAYDNSITARFKCDGTCSGDGTCNTVVDQSACTCQHGCNTDDVNDACVGTPFPGYGIPTSRSCNNAVGGKDYFEDICSQCGLVDDVRVCRANGQGISDCSTSSECDNVRPGQPSPVTRCFPSTNMLATCDQTCQLVQVSDNTCRTIGAGCVGNGDSRCDGKVRGVKIGASIDNTSFCIPDSCFVTTCPNNFRYSGVPPQYCYISCINNNQCVNPHLCQGGVCV